MFNKMARHTMPIRILFLAVYAILFSVQLHLKYNFFPSNNTGLDMDTSVIQYTTAKPAAEGKFEQQPKSHQLSIKVSKRFLHKSIYEVPVIVSLAKKEFPAVQTPVIFSASPLCQLFLLQSLHRGPPAAC